MSILSVRDVGMRFGGLQALEGISLSVAENEIFGIMGANGAGKTTLFAVIAGHLKPTSGTVSLRGRDVTGFKPDRVCRMGLTRTFQIVRPFGGMTVFDNALVAALYGAGTHPDRSSAEKAARGAIEAVGLAARSQQTAATLTLSGQKRLEVARALATGARIVMLDEVMAGLTPTEIEEMLGVIGRLRAERGITFLLIEHVMKALMRLSDRVAVLHHGKLITTGTPAAIAADPQVLHLYYGGAA